MGQSRALQKMMMVSLIESFKKFAKVSQRDRENYIKIAEEQMEEDFEAI
jgi:translation initiation factor IF-1